MKVLGNIVQGLRSVVRHPVRSALTAFTSAVAIAVTVNVISLSYGMDEDIRKGILNFGRRTLDLVRMPAILPGARRVDFGPEQEARIRAALPDLAPIVVPRRQTVVSIEGDVALGHVPLVCVGAQYPKTLDVNMVSGAWWASGDRDVCVLDGALAKKVFPDGTPVVGRTLRVTLGGQPREVNVMGVLGDPLPYRDLFETFDGSRAIRTLSASMLSFRNLYMPLGTLALGEEAPYSGISVVVPTDADVDPVHERLKRELLGGVGAPASTLHGAIDVFKRRAWMESLGGNTRRGADAGNIVWILIVLVASIMIGTLHMISVRERYDELAIRRCEGARRLDVAMQITTEGIATSLVGGLLGLPIGYAGAAVLRRIVDFPFRFELRYALLATAIAAGLGLLASVLPAFHVATLQPARVLTRRLR